ncbi:MAG: PHP domain-containing protein [Chloroflexota bacterium]|nr:PHP domain-containing protein [Chloroflexota bacterium]
MINLHNHTTWSDGSLTPQQLTDAAIAAGLTHIGITDHYHTRKLGRSGKYVNLQHLLDYIVEVRLLNKWYADDIKVLVGLEIDFSSRTQLEPLLASQLLNQLDYVLFEYVADVEWYGHSLDDLLVVRPQITVPVGLAHNPLARNFEMLLDVEDLVAVLEDHGIFVELCPARRNAVFAPDGRPALPYRYPTPYNEALWEAFSRSQVLFSIGSDAHLSAAEVGELSDAWEFLRDRGLLDHLVTEHFWK